MLLVVAATMPWAAGWDKLGPVLVDASGWWQAGRAQSRIACPHEAFLQAWTVVLPDGINVSLARRISSHNSRVCSPSTAIALPGVVSAPVIRNGRLRTWNEPPS